MEELLAGLSVDVPTKVVLTAGQILVVTQGLKRLLEKFPWVVALVEKLTGQPGIGGMAAMALAVLVAVMEAVVTTVSDGVATGPEIWMAVQTVLGAFGAHDLLKKNRGSD